MLRTLYIRWAPCLLVDKLLIKKGIEVPNRWHSSACDCTCELTRINYCLVTLSCLPCTCLCKVCSRIFDALSQALCNLSLALLADFTLSDSTAIIRFIAFSRKFQKWPAYHVAVYRANRKRSSFATKHFQRKSLKLFDLHPSPRKLVSFVAPINT